MTLHHLVTKATQKNESIFQSSLMIKQGLFLAGYKKVRFVGGVSLTGGSFSRFSRPRRVGNVAVHQNFS
jgi:hypothetical protein